METSVELQPLLTFSIWDVAIGVVLVVLAVAAMLVALHLRKKPATAPMAAPVRYRPSPSVRSRYVAAFDELKARLDAGQIDTRTCCEQVSENIRKFAGEMTGMDLSTSTLEELLESGMPSISDAVAECYGGEFPRIPEERAAKAIEKARQAVVEWC